MSRRRAALVAVLACSACSTPPRPPDVLLITVDTLRADRIGAYGYAAAQTPSLDALAARGTTFVQATTPLPRTTPALASLLTGLRPAHHGSREVGDPMTTDAATLAEVLSVRGYRTLALSASRAATGRHGLARGFDVFEVADEARADEVSRRALALVQREAGDGPIFLWVHYTDPHHPYDAPTSAPGPDDPCAALHQDLRRRERRLGLLYTNHDGAAQAALPSCSRHYDGEVTFSDAGVGALLRGLGPRAATALVVFTADHGEQLGEAGWYYEHGPTLHDASLRVPLVVAGPGVKAGHRDLGPARLEDVAPTLLGWLGVEPGLRPPSDGVDLGPRLRGAPPPEAEVALSESGSALHVTMFLALRSGSKEGLSCVNTARWSLCAAQGQAPQLYDHRDDPWLDRPQHDADAEKALAAVMARWPVEGARERAVRDGRFKLVARPAATGYVRILYDLQADPQELRDVTAEQPEALARLAPLLDRFAQELGPPAKAARDAADVEALRRLGYIE